MRIPSSPLEVMNAGFADAVQRLRRLDPDAMARLTEDFGRAVRIDSAGKFLAETDRRLWAVELSLKHLIGIHGLAYDMPLPAQLKIKVKKETAEELRTYIIGLFAPPKKKIFRVGNGDIPGLKSVHNLKFMASAAFGNVALSVGLRGKTYQGDRDLCVSLEDLRCGPKPEDAGVYDALSIRIGPLRLR